MSSPRYISIKLEIQIPTDGSAPALTLTHDPDGATRHWEGACTGTCPQSGDTVSVGTVTGSGSGLNGTICGWATFSGSPAPTGILAQVVPQGSPLGPPSGQPGVGSLGNTNWTWTATNPIPGAGYSPSGFANTLVFWIDYGSGTYVPKPVNFTGVPGTTDPCGSPGGGPCFSGSGSGSGITPVHRDQVAAAQIYPAMWCVVAGGFAVAPFVLFNAAWALRQVAGVDQPTWDNAANGESAPAIRLKLCPKNGWELALRYGDAKLTAVTPYHGTTFMPITFAIRPEMLPIFGAAMAPVIHASPM